MSKMEYLFAHCSDTPYKMNVSADDIDMWHLGMLRRKNGTFRYMGKEYKSFAEAKDALGNEVLILTSGKTLPVMNTNGRGWTRPGYSDIIMRDGTVVNLIPYDFDDEIEPWEVSNGAKGFNYNSRHFCIIGGWTKDGKKNSLFKPEELYTPEQLISIDDYINMQKEMVSGLQVKGHYMESTKTCPNMDMVEYMKRPAFK